MTTPRPTGLDITVATTPDAAISVQSDIWLLKAALLYADSVTLCSASVSWYLSRLGLIDLTEDQRLDWMLRPDISDLSDQERAGVAEVVTAFRALRAKANRTPTEAALFKAMRREIEDMWRFMAKDATSEASDAGMNELALALNGGLVRVHPLEIDPGGEFREEAIRVICESVMSGDTYPLFDAGASVLVQAAIHDGLIKPSATDVKHSRSSMLSADILQQLPQFEHATFGEILAIRRELERPLVRFRSAVLGYSAEMQSAPWDADFRAEAADVFAQHIRPAVLELEEAVEDNSLTRTLRHKMLTDNGLVKPAGLSLIASGLNAFAHFANTLVVAGAAFAAAEARELLRLWEEHAEAKRIIERSQLYFVYQAGETLKKRHK